MMKQKQKASSSSSSSKRIVAVVDASLSASLTTSLLLSTASNNARNHHCQVEVHDRPDPSLGIAANKASVQQCRSYIYVREDRTCRPNDKNATPSFSFCEIQSIPCDFGAFLLRQYPAFSPSSSAAASSTTFPPMIVGDGSLYTVTRMDPLFFLLTADRLETASVQQWQPLDQILDAVLQQDDDAALVACLKSSPKQLKHLFDELNHGGGGGGCSGDDDSDDNDDDSECFYKFSVAKALVWLTRKQQAVQQVLLQQQLKQAELKKNNNSSTVGATASSPNGTSGAGGGSFCATFNLIPDEKDIISQERKTASAITALSVEQQIAEAALRAKQDEERRLQRLESRARDESIQIVCNYLDDASWKRAFLKHLQVLSDAQVDKVLWGKTTINTSTSSSSSSDINNKRPATTTIAASAAASTSSFKPSGANSIDKRSGSSSSSIAPSTGGGNANKKPRQTAKSAGVKRLEKAAGKKERGIQKMTSFFQAIPKKKTTNEENKVNDKK